MGEPYPSKTGRLLRGAGYTASGFQSTKKMKKGWRITGEMRGLIDGLSATRW
jgi:hypothetical protein